MTATVTIEVSESTVKHLRHAIRAITGPGPYYDAAGNIELPWIANQIEQGLRLARAEAALQVERDRADDAWKDRDALVTAIDQTCDETQALAGTHDTYVTVAVLRTLVAPYRTRETP